MYGIFTYIYHKFTVNVRENSIHGAFGVLSKIVVDPKIPSSKNRSDHAGFTPLRWSWLCAREVRVSWAKGRFFLFCPRGSGSRFSKRWVGSCGLGLESESPTPFPWFPRFTPQAPFFGWVGWSGFWGGDFLGVGENPKESTVFFQPRHCGFPWYMSGENVWKIDNWNGNFDSLTNCVPYSAGAASNVVGF